MKAPRHHPSMGFAAAATQMAGSESVRCRLQMMTKVLNLLERNDFGRLVDEVV
jgi:hypothetical protein